MCHLSLCSSFRARHCTLLLIYALSANSLRCFSAICWISTSDCDFRGDWFQSVYLLFTIFFPQPRSDTRMYRRRYRRFFGPMYHLIAVVRSATRHTYTQRPLSGPSLWDCDGRFFCQKFSRELRLHIWGSTFHIYKQSHFPPYRFSIYCVST